MTSPTPARPRDARWRRRLLAALRVSGSILVIALGVIILGAFFPDAWGIGVIGSAVSGLSTWIGAVVLLALAISIWLVVRRRGVWRIAMAAISAVLLVGSVTITAQLVAVGSENGVTVNAFAGAPSTRAPDETVEYGEYDGSPLEVSIWQPTADRGSAAPVAFFTHGGGWVEGAPTDDVGGLIPKLNDAGWLVVSAGYTLADEDLQTAGLAETQVACAMAWTAANAEAYGGDPETFVSLGDSAGGNLAINTSYRANAGDLTCDDIGAMPRVEATAVLFPGVDPYALYDDTVTGGMHPGRTFLDRYIGGAPQQFPVEYAAVSSATHISDAAPQTLIIQGDNDHLVQAPAVRRFADEATDAGIDLTFVGVPYAEHVFQATPLGAEIYTKVTLEWLEERVHDGP